MSREETAGASSRPSAPPSQAEQQAFGQQLADDLPAASSHGVTHRHLAHPSRSPHQQQAGHVHAGHQHQQDDHAHHDQHGGGDLVAQGREAARAVEHLQVRFVEVVAAQPFGRVRNFGQLGGAQRVPQRLQAGFCLARDSLQASTGPQSSSSAS